MLPYLKGQKVFGYVDGTIKMHAKEIPYSDGTMQSNSAFDIWETQHNLLHDQRISIQYYCYYKCYFK